jgi:hypothetical protein
MTALRRESCDRFHPITPSMVSVLMTDDENDTIDAQRQLRPGVV